MKLILVLYLYIGIIMSQNLFFSEFVEGSSYNKAIEIFNPTNNEILLTEYQLWKVTNSEGSWIDEAGIGSYALDLSEFVIPPKDVLVICRTSFDIDNQSKCDLMNYATLNFNGDDAIGMAFDGNLIDVIGTIGDDPGSGFEVAGISNATKDHTLVRKESVLSGNVDWATSAGTNTTDSEWIVLDRDDFTNLGSHTCSACGESVSACDDNSACNFGNEGECTHISENKCDCDGNILDCNDVCGGSAILDLCGICNGPGAIYECGCNELSEGTCDCDGNVLDCNDVCGGSAVLDECGICNGAGAVYDCGCENLTEGTCDCDGNELDACGACGAGILDSANCNLELKTVRPQNYQLINAYPNPFNSSTTITLQNMGNTFVNVDIININGHLLSSIYSGYLPGLNTHIFLWDGCENNSGIYFARISQNNKIFTHKIILLK